MDLWRRRSESNRRTRICSPLRNHSATTPDGIGAGNEARTRDLNLGKVALYQLSYSRLIEFAILAENRLKSTM